MITDGSIFFFSKSIKNFVELSIHHLKLLISNENKNTNKIVSISYPEGRINIEISSCAFSMIVYDM